MIQTNTLKGKLFPFFLLLATLFSFTPDALAVSRGEVVATVVQALALPPWEGKENFADVPASHPYATFIETASAHGVLLPGDHFHPDMESTKLEALGFGFLAMGWRKEGEVVRALDKALDPDLPPYLACYLRIAEAMDIAPPESLTQNSRENCTPEDLQDLAAWLRSCKSSKLVWEMRIPGEIGELVIHREGIGAPPSAWAIQVLGILNEKEAESLAAELRKKGFPASTSNEGLGFSVRLGPYTHYLKAWKELSRLPMKYDPSIIPWGGGSDALYWTAIVGDVQTLRPSIATAASMGKGRLPLSRITQAFQAKGGINGGFFGGNKPIGTLVIDGTPVSPTYQNRSAIGWSPTGEVAFGSGAYRRSVGQSQTNTTAQEPIEPLDPIFAPPADAEPRQTSSVTPVAPVTVDTQWRDENMGRMTNVMQAGPMLLQNGQAVNANEAFSASILTPRHPRTFVGTDGSRLWWVVVDGRNSWHSMGCTIGELQSLAANMGLTTALNLDGGGSSTLVWDGVIVNAPSGGRERVLPYGILFGAEGYAGN